MLSSLKLTAMKQFSFIATALLLLFIHQSCTKSEMGGGAPGSFVDAGVAAPGSGTGGAAGVMTAGEWNDIQNWDFWGSLLARDTIKTFPGIWGFYTQNKISVTLRDANNRLIHDAIVTAYYNGTTISAKTDNFGKSQLLAGLYQPGFSLSSFILTATVNGQVFNLGSYSSQNIEITKTIPVIKPIYNTLDIMFVVDATGSMNDEISYLKTELLDVINRAGSELPGTQLRMGSVFYRDKGDDYITRPFGFTTNANELINFVNNQNAGGGGDTPEAVDQALKSAIQDQQWSTAAVNRLLFLILDAPPHKKDDIMTRLKTAVTIAQQKGIRIIPVSASGIDWETEFLLRFLEISTNGTYVFITDHSGIGNAHFTPTVGNYQVEYLNNLMVRLIAQFGKNQD